MQSPLPIFDTLEQINSSGTIEIDKKYSSNDDIKKAHKFLQNYIGSKGTFNAYRRETEKLLHWSSLIANKSIKQLTREDIERFVLFCQNPPKSWIGINKAPRFIMIEGQRTPNPEWRPFVVTISKAAYNSSERANIKYFELSQSAIKDLFAVLSTFYNYLLQEEYVQMNPVALIRQKSKFVRKFQGQQKIRRLSELQWSYVIETANEMANNEPYNHERTLFIMSALYSMYLRISELVALNKRWSPKMNHFYRDAEDNWWVYYCWQRQ